MEAHRMMDTSIARMHVSAITEQTLTRLHGMAVSLNAVSGVVFSYIRESHPALLEVLSAREIQQIIETTHG